MELNKKSQNSHKKSYMLEKGQDVAFFMTMNKGDWCMILKKITVRLNRITNKSRIN